jgi:hypothetical protein
MKLPPMSFVSNTQFDLAFEYVRNTRTNVFLTGKAGTGKTKIQLLRKLP